MGPGDFLDSGDVANVMCKFDLMNARDMRNTHGIYKHRMFSGTIMDA